MPKYLFHAEMKLGENRIREFGKRLRDVTLPLSGFWREKEKLIERQFDTNSDPFGNAWTPLKASTIRQKKQNKDKILTHYGKMRRQFKAKIEKVGILIYNEAGYSGFHQTGTKKMPRRLLLAITPDDVKRMKTLINTYMRGRRV